MTAQAVFDSIPYILTGIWMTLRLTVLGLLLGGLLGLPLALGRTYGNRLVSSLINLYIQTMRSLPLLVLIFVFYSAFDLPAFFNAMLPLAIRSSVYQAELFRGAILSVDSGQMLAARSLGMSKLSAIVHVIVPQALRIAIPSWSNEAAIVLKDSSLAYAVGVLELLRRAEYVSARTGEPLITFTAVGAIYFLLTFTTNRGLDLLERKVRIPT